MCDPVSAGIAVGGLSALGGISSSRSARKLQKQALDIQQGTLDFAKQRYGDYKTTYSDLEKMVVDSAKKGVVADLSGVTARAANDVSTQFANAEGARIRNAQRLGINPNSGRADAMASQNALSESLAKAGNITFQRENERRNAEDKTFQRRLAVDQMGINQMNMAANDVTQASNGLVSAYNNSANQRTQEANQLFGVAGTVAGMGMSGGMGSGANTTQSAPPTLLAARNPSTPAYTTPQTNSLNSLYSAIGY